MMSQGRETVPTEHEEFKLKSLRQAVAQGDADFAAGRARAYKAGELAEELRHALPHRRKNAEESSRSGT